MKCKLCDGTTDFRNIYGMVFSRTTEFDDAMQCRVHRILSGGTPNLLMFCGHDYASGKKYRDRIRAERDAVVRKLVNSLK